MTKSTGQVNERAGQVSERTKVVIVTGMYGAGKSTALIALQELGYFCIDNLPASVVPAAVVACEEGGARKIGFGFHVGRALVQKDVVSTIDGLGILTPNSSEGAAEEESEVQEVNPSREVVILFLDASDQALVRRFNETRRPHPLLAQSPSKGPSASEHDSTRPRATSAVLDGVRLERERLAPIRARATFELDTSTMSVHDLRRRVIEMFTPDRESHPRMETRFVSFGFKYGAPIDANVMFDVRFLDNPYFVPELRPLTGLDASVREHVFKSDDAKMFLEKVSDLLMFSLPRYEQEGKSYLTVAIGCTGGQHRSVAMAEELAQRTRRGLRGPVTVVHRDVGRVLVDPQKHNGEAT